MKLSVNIQKTLGKFQLDVAFEADGGVLALLGASGCGKTMTLKCIAGIEKPDSGFIRLGDKTLFDSEKGINLPPQKREVGYLFQDYALFPNMTVFRNISAGAMHLTRRDRDCAAKEIISSYGLSGLENLRPHQLSGGQKQRVALARILVGAPSLLLLDEPFTALDSALRWQMELELKSALSGFEGPAVFVSHNREEVYRICDNVCVITSGKSGRRRGKQELFDAPDTLSEFLLTGRRNYSPLSIGADGKLIASDWNLPVELPYTGSYPYVGLLDSPKLADSGGVPCTLDYWLEDITCAWLALRPKGASGRLYVQANKPMIPRKSYNIVISRDVMLLLK
ncbi:MAG: sulfate/molybdate ABC transporter ATP-binding protein [Oscillospiraceae bacterium]